jgi:hypothetical protein
MTLGKMQKSLVELENQLNYDETILLMQVTYIALTSKRLISSVLHLNKINQKQL